MTAAFLAFLGLFSLFASQTPGKISPSFGSTPFRKPAQQAKCKLGEPVTLKGTFVVFSPDGNDFVTNSSEEGPGLHEARSGRLIRRFQIEPPCRVVDARFSPDGQFIVFAAFDANSIPAYNVKTGQPARQLRDLAWSGGPLTFSPDGKLLAAKVVAKDFGLQTAIWNVLSGEAMPPMKMDGPGELAFSKDGKFILTEDLFGTPHDVSNDRPGIRDQSLQFRVATNLWDVQTGKVLGKIGQTTQHIGASFRGAGFSVLGVKEAAFSVHITPGGTLLLFPDIGRLFLRWLESGDFNISYALEADSNEACAELKSHRVLARATLSPNEQWLAGVGLGGKVLVWPVIAPQDHSNKLSPNQLEAYWNDLAAAESRKGQRAASALATCPDQFLAFAKKTLAVPRSPNKDVLEALANKLSDPNFHIREDAYVKLLEAGEDAIPIVKKLAVDNLLSEEGRKRAQQFLKTAEQKALPATTMQFLWSLHILEYVGNADAKTLLKDLAIPNSDSWLALEARASLLRLETQESLKKSAANK
jgi:WD40 repeat protein